MFVLPGYDAFLGFLLIAAAVPVLALVTNKLLSPSSRRGERQLTYESGMEPIGGAWIQFNIRYYMFALVFVIFDVETVFLYPWAVAFHRLGLLAFIEALHLHCHPGGCPCLRLAERRPRVELTPPEP